jgi:hypothetical protein
MGQFDANLLMERFTTDDEIVMHSDVYGTAEDKSTTLRMWTSLIPAARLPVKSVGNENFRGEGGRLYSREVASR